MEKIRSAFERGTFDEKTKIKSYLYTLFDRDRLSDEFKSELPIKSGTTAVKEIHDYMRKKNADRDLIEMAERYLSSAIPKLDRTYTSQSGYFKIHYTLDGANAVPAAYCSYHRGIPVYVEAVGAAFDKARHLTCTTRGFLEPILDQNLTTFDIYVYDLKNKYGITFPSSFRVSRNGLKTASSYICMDNNYSRSKGFKKDPIDCMRVTAAHEFFHAVQNAYNADADVWWKEACATWNEDEVYRGVNDYVQYLTSVFSSSGRSLEQNSYGGVVFAKYLAENWGGYDIVKRIWDYQSRERCSSVNAIDKVIRKEYPNQNLGTVFNKYTAYNFNPSQYYNDGATWNMQPAIQNTHSVYPVESKKEQLNHLSTNYQLFKPDASSEKMTLKITVDGADKKNWGFKVQKRNVENNLCELVEFTVDGRDNKVKIVCENFGEVYKEICLIPANLEKSADELSYTYSAVLE